MEFKKMNKEEKEKLFIDCLHTKNYNGKNSKWTILNAENGHPFADGERLRCWFKAEANKRIADGVLDRKEVYPQEEGFLEPVRNYEEKLDINGDGSQLSDKLIAIQKNEIKDTNAIMRLHGYDPDKWEVIKVSNSIWNSPTKNSDKIELYASKLFVKPRASVSMEQIDNIFERIAARVPRVEEKSFANYSSSGKILEICLTDFHFGMQSWKEETGFEYNMKIAEEKFFYILDDVISKSKFVKLQKIYFIFCHDFFHCNNQERTTNKGTSVDTDGRMFKMFDKGIELLVDGIERLRRYAPVETVWLHSNHSADTSYYAVKCLEAYFRNDNKVIVDANPSPRKYRAFGKCLLGMAHGDNEGKRAQNIMQLEVPELFGQAKYRCLHLGHQHHEKVEDVNGVVVRYLPSPAPADNWHAQQGFIGAQKKVQSFIWDEDKGVEFVIQTMLDY